MRFNDFSAHEVDEVCKADSTCVYEFVEFDGEAYFAQEDGTIGKIIYSRHYTKLSRLMSIGVIFILVLFLPHLSPIIIISVFLSAIG